MSKYGMYSLAFIVMCAFFCTGMLRSQVATGNLSGSIRDPSGAALPGVTVVVLNEATGVGRTVRTDSAGHYAAPSLGLGSYRVTATLQGFETVVHSNIVLTVGRDEVVDLTMPLGAVSQSINVTDRPPLMETTTGSLASLVDATTIRDLPLNGRSYDQLATIQPGVTSASPGPVGVGNAFSFGTGQRFSVNGLRANTNLFLLDGLNINDQANATPGGAAGTNLGVDTILEFRIYTNAYKAEFGHSMGSVTTAVTRSGTNAIHGTVFEYVRNSVLDASNYFDASPQPSFRRNQFGGVIGGPIRKDKMFYFAGYEGLRQALGTTLFATVPTMLARTGVLPTQTVTVNPAILPYLALYPIPNARDFGDGSGQYESTRSTVTNEDNVMGKFDYQINTNNAIFARYTYDADGINSPQSIPSETQVTTSERQYSTVNWSDILSTRLLNNLRFGYNITDNSNNLDYSSQVGSSLSFVPGEPMGALQIGAIGTSGSRALTALGPSTGNGPFYWDFRNLQGSDDLNWTFKKHSLKFGVDIERIMDDFTNSNSLQGTYTFSTFANFLQGIASNLQASSPLGQIYVLAFRQTLYGTYAQDDYQISPRLMLNLGLRWEATTDAYDKDGKTAILPTLASTSTEKASSFYTSPKKNFEPRVGMAWQATADGKTVVRLGAGIYQNQILPYIYENQGRVPPYGGNLSATNPPFPDGSQTLLATAQTSFLVLDYHEKTPTAYQYNLSIQQQIPGNSFIQISYAGTAADHLQSQKEGNSPIPIICSTALSNCPAGVPNGEPYYPAGAPRRNPAYGGIRYFDSNARSRYDSLTFLLRHESPHGFIGQIFYTFSKDMDDSSASAAAESQRSPASVKDPDDIGADWSLSDYDQKNSVVGYVTYLLPYRTKWKGLRALANDWTLNAIGQFRGGLPFTPILSTPISRNLSVAGNAETPNLNPGFSENPTHGVSAGCSGFPTGTKVGTAGNWFDPCAFSLPIAGTYGDLKRNTLIGPGLEDVDFAVQKNFKATERINATLKAELFNIANHPNFGLPNVTALAASGAANPSAGTITYTVTSSRQLQLALRINF